MQDLGNKKIMSANLRRLMAERKINAKDLSRILNFPYTTLLSWVRGENYPRIDKIEAMADYFGVLKSDLIEEKTADNKKNDNEMLSSIVVRARMEEDFKLLIESLLTLDESQIKGIRQMLQTFTQDAKD